MDWEEDKIPRMVNVSEEEYHNMNYCSYSVLSKIDKSGYRALQEKKKESKALNLGSFIDCYVLTPEQLSERFAPVPIEPTASLKVLADYVLENYDSVPENLIEIADALSLWSGQKTDTIKKKFTREFLDYLQKAIKNKDKTFYSHEDLDLAIKVEAGLKENELTNFIFYPKDFGLDEVMFQIQGIFEMEDEHGTTTPIKFMVDILTVNHQYKTVYLYDLKTGMEPIDKFEISFLKYRYDIQHYLYTKGIEAIKEQLEFKNYKVIPLQFIYVSKIEPKLPVIYRVPDHIDIYNGYTTKSGSEMVGVKQLLDDYSFYLENPYMPRRIHEEGPILTLDI